MKQIKNVEISSFEQIAPQYFEHVISALETKVSAELKEIWEGEVENERGRESSEGDRESERKRMEGGGEREGERERGRGRERESERRN